MTAQKNNADHRVQHPLSDTRLEKSVLGDKGIAVKVRGNSHYRNSRFDESSRNAYRSVTQVMHCITNVKGLSGKWGGCAQRYGRSPLFSQHPVEGCFYLFLCRNVDLLERMKENEKSS